jgi:hypothetical protein
VCVRNALGQEWVTVGDAGLSASPQTQAMAELASKASRDAVQDVLDTGTTARGQAALDYIPDVARLGDGGFRPIADFSRDPAVWNPVMAVALSTNPAENDLYKLIVGYAGPIVDLQLRKAERKLEDVERRWKEGPVERWKGIGKDVKEGAEGFVRQLEKDLERYPPPTPLL